MTEFEYQEKLMKSFAKQTDDNILLEALAKGFGLGDTYGMGLPSKRGQMIGCEFCQNHEQGDTLYELSDWDGGIGFDYIRDIKYCPLCGSLLNGEAKNKSQTERDNE